MIFISYGQAFVLKTSSPESLILKVFSYKLAGEAAAQAAERHDGALRHCRLTVGCRVQDVGCRV
jgi:hypothetical protein